MNQRGIALLSVLLLVAVLSVMAMTLVDDIGFNVRRGRNAEMIGQATWYALGAELLARARLTALANKAFDQLAGDSTRNGRWIAFPIADGVLRARLSDATHCFNLNSVVEGVAEQWQRRPLGVAQFRSLLEAVGTPARDAASLSEALVDWIDSDGARGLAGAEDEAYAEAARPYRTSGALLAEVSELRAICGFTVDVYARLKPIVCALPTAALSPLNVNTLSPDDAVLLTAISEGQIFRETARDVLRARPATGWSSVDAFWREPRLQAGLPQDAVLAQVAVTTRFVSLDTVVTYGDAETALHALFERASDGEVRLVARRLGADE